jgi:hypothetical protein
MPLPHDVDADVERDASLQLALYLAQAFCTRHSLEYLDVIERERNAALQELVHQASEQRIPSLAFDPTIEESRAQLYAHRSRLSDLRSDAHMQRWADDLQSMESALHRVQKRQHTLEVLLRALSIHEDDAAQLRRDDLDVAVLDALGRVQRIESRLKELPAEMRSWKLIQDAQRELHIVLESAWDRVQSWVRALDWAKPELPIEAPESHVLLLIRAWLPLLASCLQPIVAGRQQVLLRELQRQWDEHVRNLSPAADRSTAGDEVLRLINDLFAIVHQQLELEKEQWLRAFAVQHPHENAHNAGRHAAAEHNAARATDLVQTILRQSSDVYADAMSSRLKMWIENESLPLSALHEVHKFLVLYEHFFQRVLGTEAGLPLALASIRREVLGRCVSGWRERFMRLLQNNLIIPHDLSIPPLLLHEAEHLRACLEIQADPGLPRTSQSVDTAQLTDVVLESVDALVRVLAVRDLDPLGRSVFVGNTLDAIVNVLAHFWTEVQRARLEHLLQEHMAAYIAAAVDSLLQRCRLLEISKLAGSYGDPFSAATEHGQQREASWPSLEALALRMRAFESLLFDAPVSDWFPPPLMTRIRSLATRQKLLFGLASALLAKYRQLVSAISESGAFSAEDVERLHLRDVTAVEERLQSLVNRSI